MRAWFLVWLAAGCGPAGIDLGGKDGDSGEPPPVTYDEAQVSDLTSWVDEEIGSLVWVQWEQGVAAHVRVEYRFEGEEWWATPTRLVDAGQITQVLLGIPFDSSVEFRVVNELGGAVLTTEPSTESTDAVPSGAPEAGSVEGDPERWDAETRWVFLSVSGSDYRTWYIVVDREGRLVWALRSPEDRVSLHPRISLDGRDLLLDEGSFWAAFDGGAASRVVRAKLDGTIVEELDTPGLHHPFTDLPDGSILYTAYKGVNDRSETLDRRWPDGTITTVWDCQDLVEAVGDSGYCGSNTLWYNPANGRVLYSLYSLETIVDVDLDAGEPVRWFGHLNDSWSFDPPESAFWWQHGGYITEAGTLLTSSKGEDSDNETVIREYAFDEANEALVEVWSFGEGEGVYGDVMGEAHRLPGGNTLHNYGSATRLREATPEGEVVWDVNWRADVMGRSTPLSDLYALVD